MLVTVEVLVGAKVSRGAGMKVDMSVGVGAKAAGMGGGTISDTYAPTTTPISPTRKRPPRTNRGRAMSPIKLGSTAPRPGMIIVGVSFDLPHIAITSFTTWLTSLLGKKLIAMKTRPKIMTVILSHLIPLPFPGMGTAWAKAAGLNLTPMAHVH